MDYNAGASQFGGGGFMPSQAQNEAGFGGNLGQAKKAGGAQTIRSVTIKQIWKENSSIDDDNFRVDGIELHIVTIIGKILTVSDNSTRILMSVSDGTGEIEVVQFLDSNEIESRNKVSELIPGIYVRVYGTMRSFERKKNINAYSIRPIKDFNEVSHHLLRCIFEHLHLKQMQTGPTSGGGQQNPVGGNFGGQGGPSYGGAGGFGGGGSAGFQPPYNSNFQGVNNPPGGGPYGGAAPGYPSTSPLGGVGGGARYGSAGLEQGKGAGNALAGNKPPSAAEEILSFIRSQCRTSSDDVHISKMSGRFPRYSIPELKKILGQLQQDAQVYETQEESYCPC